MALGCACRLRRAVTVRKIAAATRSSTATATPTPKPAFAPVVSPEEAWCDGTGVLVGVAVERLPVGFPFAA